MRRIVVSSNCQTAGLVVALQELLPLVQVEPVPLGAGTRETFAQEFDARVADADVWVALPGHEHVTWALQSRTGLAERCVQVPAVAFTAFHPDLCYAWNRTTQRLTEASHYNSLIGIWGYRRGLSARATAAYFRREVFQALGYFTHWAPSVRQLQWAFEHSDLKGSFEPFFLRVKRTGCFMHSINHPRMGVMTALARAIVERLGLPAHQGGHLGHLPDALQGTIWPVYPEIAEHYGLNEGSWSWRFDMHRNRWICGLEPYLERAFNAYQTQGLTAENFEVTFRDATAEWQALDAILEAGGP